MQTLKVKEGFMLREVAGSYVVVAVGKASQEFKGLITLNETGAFLWKQLENGATVEDLLKKLLEEYNVTQEEAKKGVEGFIKKVIENKLVEEKK